MNERIEQLVEQADNIEILPDEEFCDTDFLADIDPRRVKKFAELIVEKFDDILVLELVDCIGNQDKQAEQRIERLRERVKTYFGVE